MKRLIFFGYTLQMGGAEKVLIDFIKILKEKGYDIDLVLLQKKGDLLQDVPKDVNIYEIRKNNFTYAFFRYIPFVRKKVINKIVNQKNYDVAIGFIEGRSATWIADIKKNIKKIAWIHTDVAKFDIGISEKEAKKSYKKINKIVTVSNKAKEIFCNKYEIDINKVEVLENIINEKDIIEKAKISDKQRNSKYTFINVGKMRPEKRQDRLIEIAKKLKEEGYNFKIQIIGDGPEEANIKNMIKEYKVEDKIELLGIQINPYPYVNKADCFVLSSELEGFGIAVKEALLLKKIVISTTVTGIEEMLKNNKYGILVDNSTNGLYQAMKDVLDNKIDIKKIKKNLKNFDCGNEKIIKKLIEIIEG